MAQVGVGMAVVVAVAGWELGNQVQSMVEVEGV
jgi:hypothetical protein